MICAHPSSYVEAPLFHALPGLVVTLLWMTMTATVLQEGKFACTDVSADQRLWLEACIGGDALLAVAVVSLALWITSRVNPSAHRRSIIAMRDYLVVLTLLVEISLVGLGFTLLIAARRCSFASYQAGDVFALLAACYRVGRFSMALLHVTQVWHPQESALATSRSEDDQEPSQAFRSSQNAYAEPLPTTEMGAL